MRMFSVCEQPLSCTPGKSAIYCALYVNKMLKKKNHTTRGLLYKAPPEPLAPDRGALTIVTILQPLT